MFYVCIRWKVRVERVVIGGSRAYRRRRVCWDISRLLRNGVVISAPKIGKYSANVLVVEKVETK